MVGKTKSLQTLGGKVELALHVGEEGHLGGEISYQTGIAVSVPGRVPEMK